MPDTPAALPALTEEQLAIPHRISCKYLACAMRQRLTYDDLLSEAGYAMALALAAWREERAYLGTQNLGPYLVQRVEWRVRDLIWPKKVVRERWRQKHVSLDEPLAGSERLTISREVRSHEPPPDKCVADAEEVRRALRVLPPRERRLLWLYFGEDRFLREAAQEIGVTTERARQLVERALERVRSRIPAT